MALSEHLAILHTRRRTLEPLALHPDGQQPSLVPPQSQFPLLPSRQPTLPACARARHAASPPFSIWQSPARRRQADGRG